MLKVKDRYDYRRELCEALRSGKYMQIPGCDPSPNPNEGCVIRVFAMINDIWDDKQEVEWHSSRLPYDDFERLTGIKARDVYERNDGRRGFGKVKGLRPHSFAELADYIESLP